MSTTRNGRTTTQKIATVPQVKILFVCTGNTCRSPMAEIIFKAICKQHHRTGVMVRSAGTNAAVGMTMMPEAVTALRLYGYRLPKTPHTAKQYWHKMQKQYHYIYSLQNYPDPYGRGQDAYNALCLQLQGDLAHLYHQIFDLRTAPVRL